jgi:hypothetical protein
MKILKAVLIIGIFSFILICILTFIFAKIYLTPEAIKDSFCLEIEKRLRREISIDNVDIKLLRGINLKGVIVHKSLPWEKEDVFTCEEVHIKHGLVPLIFKKLLIRKITFKNPRINIQFVHDQPLRLYGNVRPSQVSNKPLGIIFLPGSINARDGKVIFNDLTNKISFSVKNIKASADDISLISPFEFTISANLQESTASDVYCKGEFSILKNELKADITLRKIPLISFKDYFNAYNIPIKKGFLTVESNLKTNGSTPLTLSGNVILEEASFPFKPAAIADEYTGLEGIKATLSFQSVLDTPKGLFTIKKINGKLISSPYEGDGFIRKKDNTTFITFSVRSEKFSLDDLFNKLRQTPTSITKGLKLSGNIGLKAGITGKLDESLSPTVMLNLRGNRILYPPLGSVQPELQGSLRIDRDNISIAELQIGTKNLSITLSGDISGYMQWPPKSNLKIVSSRINFDDLFTPSESEPMDEVGPFDLKDLTFDGPIKLGNTSFFGMRIDNVRGRYLFEKNKFFIKDLEGNIGKGSFNLSTTIDLGVKGLDYYLHLKLDDAPIKSIMSMFPADYSQFIDGTVSGTCALKGNGTKPTSFTENLKGDAFLYMSNGHIKGLTLMPQLSSLIRSEQLEDISFNKAQLHLKLHSGTVELDGALINPKIELYPSGELGFDSSLDLEAKLRISPDLFTDSTKLARYLPQEDGWITLPITIKGTLQNTHVSLSEDTLKFILKETLPRLLMDMLSEQEDNATEEILENIPDVAEAEVEKEAEMVKEVKEAEEVEEEMEGEAEAEKEMEVKEETEVEVEKISQ